MITGRTQTSGHLAELVRTFVARIRSLQSDEEKGEIFTLRSLFFADSVMLQNTVADLGGVLRSGAGYLDFPAWKVRMPNYVEWLLLQRFAKANRLREIDLQRHEEAVQSVLDGHVIDADTRVCPARRFNSEDAWTTVRIWTTANRFGTGPPAEIGRKADTCTSMKIGTCMSCETLRSG